MLRTSRTILRKWKIIQIYAKGSSINHVVKFLGIFNLPSWSLLINKTYVIKWSFHHHPLPPQLTTWFMDDPKGNFDAVTSLRNEVFFFKGPVCSIYFQIFDYFRIYKNESISDRNKTKNSFKIITCIRSK